ncbi:MAG TPA: M20/M25/M40 family metallo-hydrolase, partial [Caulobacteraceae bacterium]
TTSRTPAPLSAGAPAQVFSAGRAMGDIAAMAPVPHPIGSPANARVRDYLVQRMTALGLSPQVQRDRSQRLETYNGETYVGGGDVENVIGVLPGRDHALPALALMAHYDSVPGSAGAADDITGVAAVLESVRALKAQGVPSRDVMLVITDGEEAGLLGANAFFAHSPSAKHVGFILNLESRGGGGLPTMFETGAGNGGAIDVYRKATAKPNANSLTVFIYKKLPNDTDYTVARARGVPGLNYAFIGRQFDYHSPSSTVAALDQGSVQNIGDQALDTARAIAFAQALPPARPDAVYSSLFGHWLVAYPAWIGWILLAAIAGVLAIAAWRAHRLEPLSWVDILQGGGVTLLLLVGAAVVLHLARSATGVGIGWIDGRALLARFAPFEFAMALAGLGSLMLVATGLSLGWMRVFAAVLAIAAGLASSIFHDFDTVALGEGVAAAALSLILLGRPASAGGSWLGLMLVALLAATALQSTAPTIAFVVAWPLAVAATCAALTASGRRSGLAGLIALALTILALAWIGGLFHSLLQALDVPELPVLPLWLTALVLWPLMGPAAASRRLSLAPAAGLVALGVGLSLWLHFTTPWSPRHPRAAEPCYLVDHDSGQAYRISPFMPDRWARDVLTADGGAIGMHAFPGFRRDAWAAPARAVKAEAPPINLAQAIDGTVTLHAGLGHASELALDLRVDAPVRDARLNGEPVAILAKPGQWVHLRWQAAPEGVSASFKPLGHGTVEVRYAAYTPSWPADAKPLPPMPNAVMAWNMAGSTIVTGTLRSNW